MLTPTPVIRYQDNHVTISSWHSLLTYVYFEPMTIEHIKIGRRLHKEQSKRVGQKFPVALFFRNNRLDENGGSESVRNELTLLVREASESVAICTVVLESTGFIAAALRSVATAVALIARPAFALKFVDSPAQCAPLLLPFVTGPTSPLTAGQLTVALTELRDPPRKA